MPTKKKKATSISARISTPELVFIDFALLNDQEEDQEIPEIEFSIGVARVAKFQVIAELKLELERIRTFRCKISYRATLTLDLGKKDAEEEEINKYLRDMVFNIAPAALYPFIREAVNSVTSKAGLKIGVLPIVNFRELFNEEDIIIPPLEQ